MLRPCQHTTLGGRGVLFTFVHGVSVNMPNAHGSFHDMRVVLRPNLHEDLVFFHNR